MNMLKKRPFLRKLIVLSFLALAGIGAGEIYQYFSTLTIEETLVHHQSKLLMTSTMRINGVDMIGKTWRLPPGVSANILKEAKGRALVVQQPLNEGHIVYSFDQHEPPAPTDRFYPSTLPKIEGFSCHYTIDMTNARTIIMGASPLSREEMMQRTHAALAAHGWHYDPMSLTWTKGAFNVQSLFQSSEHGCSGIIQLELRK